MLRQQCCFCSESLIQSFLISLQVNHTMWCGLGSNCKAPPVRMVSATLSIIIFMQQCHPPPPPKKQKTKQKTQTNKQKNPLWAGQQIHTGHPFINTLDSPINSQQMVYGIRTLSFTWLDDVIFEKKQDEPDHEMRSLGWKRLEEGLWFVGLITHKRSFCKCQG